MNKAQNELFLKLSSAQFAMWELHVFLDTHPNNKEAYALKEKYGPLTINTDTPNAWLKDPWPWDLTECDD